MKLYYTVMTTIGMAAAIVYELYILYAVLDICRVIAAG